MGFVKLDVDGNSQGNSRKIGLGGLVRDNEGKWLVGFSSIGGFDTNLLPELLDIKHGLVLAWNQGYRKIICNLDCINASRRIHDGNFIFQKLGVVIVDTKKLLSREWEVHLLHLLREANSCADFMAKHGARNLAEICMHGRIHLQV